MKKFVAILLISILILIGGCKTKSNVEYYGSQLNTEIIGNQAIKTTVSVTNRQGFNSICKDERISSDLTKWSQVAFQSYEDHTGFIQYYYLKSDFKKSEGIAEKFYKLDLDINKNDTIFNLEVRAKVKIK